MKISPLSINNWLLLPIFILICYGVAYIGAVYTPGEWYEGLNRAPWSPPNIAFPIVWGILYLFIAIAGWLTFINDNFKLKFLWILQLTLNGIWTWVFFGQHWVLLGLIDLIVLDICVVTLITSYWKQKLAVPALLLSPYFIWLCIATSLNGYILLAN